MTSTSKLVAAAQSGDHRAFTSLIRSVDERMRRLAYRLMGSQAAMDDALQDAYFKAYRKIGSYRGDSAFSTWLYTLVYRTCLDHLRATTRRRETSLEQADSVVDLVDHESRAVDHDALASGLAALPTDQAAAVLLVDGDGLTYAEAAAVCGCREGTIASRLSRAHTTLQVLLVDSADSSERGDMA